ncbi:MAG: formate dehydrogenase subunit gamma [Bacillota bacterium]
MATIKARSPVHRPEHAPEGKVLRFSLGERLAHWNHAITFLVLLFTGMALVVRGVAGSLGQETLVLFGQIHRVAAVPFTLLTIPILLIAARKAAGEWFRDSFRFDKDDLGFLKGFAVEFFGGHVKLPDQGKFNAGEKVNSILQILGWPVMVVTGWMMVFKTELPRPLMEWVIPIHSITALLLGCAVLGHIYLATLHPSSRAGLSGMFSGWVPADWAKAHYRKWYNEITKK